MPIVISTSIDVDSLICIVDDELKKFNLNNFSYPNNHILDITYNINEVIETNFNKLVSKYGIKNFNLYIDDTPFSYGPTQRIQHLCNIFSCNKYVCIAGIPCLNLSPKGKIGFAHIYLTYYENMNNNYAQKSNFYLIILLEIQ